jgi:hypothetical protein
MRVNELCLTRCGWLEKIVVEDSLIARLIPDAAGTAQSTHVAAEGGGDAMPRHPFAGGAGQVGEFPVTTKHPPTARSSEKKPPACG